LALFVYGKRVKHGAASAAEENLRVKKERFYFREEKRNS